MVVVRKFLIDKGLFMLEVQGESRKPTDFLSRNKPCRNVRRVAYHVEPKALD